MASASVRDVVVETLRQCELAEHYADEQGDLQPDLAAKIRVALEAQCPGSSYRTILSVGPDGTLKPRVNAFRTSFWPDIEVVDHEHRKLIAVEVKHVRDDQSASTALAEAVGKALIYRAGYPDAVAFVLNRGKADPRLSDADHAIMRLLKDVRVELVVRR